MGKDKDQIPCSLPLPSLSLNHVSFICKSVTASKKFYENVLGFQVVRRPSSFDFGAWLFKYGFGIHLLQCKSSDNLPKKTQIDPKDNHISFQSPDILLVEKKLQEMDIKYEKRIVEEEGLYVDQLFFHDPDGYMIEICNCENLPVVPVTSVPFSVKSTFLGFAFPQSKPASDAKFRCSVGPMLKLKLCQTLPKTVFSSLPARSSLSGSLAPGYRKDILAPVPKTPSKSVPPTSDSPKTPKTKLLTPKISTEKSPT